MSKAAKKTKKTATKSNKKTARKATKTKGNGAIAPASNFNPTFNQPAA